MLLPRWKTASGGPHARVVMTPAFLKGNFEMNRTVKTPPLGAAGLSESSCLAADEAAQNPAATQAAIVALQRDYIAEALRIAALKAAHGADNVEIADDSCAERDIKVAIENLREAAGAFRQLRRMVSP